MDLSRKAVLMILQFLDEHSYKNTLRELIHESGVEFEGVHGLPSGKLISLIDRDLELTSHLNSRHTSIEIEDTAEDSVYVTRELVRFDAIGCGSNVLITLLNTNGYLISGCSDKNIHILKLKCPILSHGYQLEEPRSLSIHQGGVVSLDIHPNNQNMIASGSMDATLAIYDISSPLDEPLQKFTDHQKFVVRVKWSPSGQYLVTASHDKSFIVYKWDTDTKTLNKIHKLEHSHIIEGLAFKNKSDEFIISLRDCSYLYWYRIEIDEVIEFKKVNLNEYGDDHVSFNALDISFSPNDNMILVSTDRQHAILLDSNTGQFLLKHYGFISDELCQPRHCWHPSGLYFYETCQDHAINVVSVALEKVVHRLIGHTQLVVRFYRNDLRNLSFSRDHNVLVSSSYDGSVRIWTY
ncbi:putative WD repeat-containing protein [Thelohanellus kitauei]|uniref:Putative WD repeat-containing protein n=1 Tax=Thelohanellus kitauei TaxID=669202 RepID=A0A0C2JUW4_THEKT|nr:putative WD repeat-containing protein [Thelohanellus kitauei]